MQLKECIKNKICLINLTPNYPLGEFVRWVEASQIEISLLSVLLDEIQTELDVEARIHSAPHLPGGTQYRAVKGYWCLYCSQVRAYYQAIIRAPDCKQQLSFLLK